jgi:hypothetical protein
MGVVMMRCVYSVVMVAAICVLSSGSRLDAAIMTTASGVYDEQTTQLNQVDQTATAPISGSISLISLAQFKSDLATAFPLGLGGVIHFDDVSGPITNQTEIKAAYASGSKTLTVTGTGNQVDMNALTAVNAQPISGSNYLRNTVNTGVQLYSFDTGLSAVGVTVLARNVARNITALITYDDNSTGTLGPFTVGAVANGLTSNATPDTFFGFSAPTGKLITSLRLSAGQENFFVIDDLAFITPTAIPEPSTYALIGMTAIGLAGTWMRKKRSA